MLTTPPQQNTFSQSSNVMSTIHQGIAVLELFNPPVNALNAGVKQALEDAIAAANSNNTVKAIVLCGNGDNFCAGADIREFGNAKGPNLSELCKKIENNSKLIVAAVTGACLGGGLELALSAHYRVASKKAKLGLPEVNLGLIPGAGGTQRAPRLIGAEAALELMLSGRPINAQQAEQYGLVDAVIEQDDLLLAALHYTRQLLTQNSPVRRTCDASGLLNRSQAEQAITHARANKLRDSGLFSPAKIIDAVEASLTLPFEKGLETEQRLFQECLASPQRSALVHAFFAEKACSKVPETEQSNPAQLTRIAVIGAGTMGVGISIALLDGGYHVQLLERDYAALERGQNAIRDTYQKLLMKKRITAEEVDERLSRLSPHIDYSVLADTDLVIEAVFEDMAVKKALLTQLAAACRADAILATNTSYLDIDEMAKTISNPQRVIGIHFFSPANIMKLVEVVVPEQTDNRAVATAFALAKSLKKIPVRAGNADGFIGNRMLFVYREAAELMMLDGASPYQIDEAIREFGFPMGPFEVVDLAGGDISWATRKRKAPLRDPRLRYVSLADKLCERGWFGRKSGIGYYLYDKDSRGVRPNPEVELLLNQVRVEAGITPRAFTNKEIVERYLAAMVNEGANVLDQKIALRPLDIDVVLINGYGFPRHKGGPMMYADTLGLAVILSNIKQYGESDSLFWRPSPLLERLVLEGAKFTELNA